LSPARANCCNRNWTLCSTVNPFVGHEEKRCTTEGTEATEKNTSWLLCDLCGLCGEPPQIYRNHIFNARKSMAATYPVAASYSRFLR